MAIVMKQISALNKVQLKAPLDFKEIDRRTVMQGERFCYQVAINLEDMNIDARIWAESDLGDAVKLFVEKDVFVDSPATEDITGENYIITEPGFLPDVLIPLEERNNLVSFRFRKNGRIFVKVDIPSDIAPGEYKIKLHLGTLVAGDYFGDYREHETKEMTINVIAAVIPEQKLIFTRWFYVDCIADYHNVEPYSEAHWALIDAYMAQAVNMGINMLLVPVHTPPLDTEIGARRTCVQLVDIEKKGDVYEFNFDKFHRYIAMCKKNGIKYFEIAHLFSQWGSKCAPNIMVTENGETYYKFGWHVAADDPEYIEFLKQYIKAIADALKREGVSENAYFHISDEPNLTNIDRYEIAYNIIKSLIGNSKTIDALSHVEFYDKGFVQYPVTSVREAHTFIDHQVKDLWTYYCCGPQTIFPNSFIAMPSARVRILGLLLYKYDIKGFLHWGFNFYNSMHSNYHINPYLTTSADGTFPSGDPFVVYPSKDGAYESIRCEVLFDAIQDMRVCDALAQLIGKEAVVKMIDDAAGRDLRFDDYPCDNEFLDGLREAMVKAIAENTK